MHSLEAYGIDARIADEAASFPEQYLARVTAQHKERYTVVTEEGEGLAEVSGKFRYGAAVREAFPVVGDFVMVDRVDTRTGNALIHHVLARKSVFRRAAAGQDHQTQIIAANIDLVCICMSLNQDYNLSRLERYLSVAWDSGATPVVVLTKADLCPDIVSVYQEVSAAAVGAEIVVTSSVDQGSCDGLRAMIRPGMTASLIGSSGVGKSTLINRLAGEALLATGGVRQDDDKGRHTTTRRELLLLPGGGMVIDTPGMRELGIDSADFSKSFADIGELAALCRFSDCSHMAEPGCAVQAAIVAGELDQRRFLSYEKLRKEARYDGLNAKQIEREKINTMFGGISEMKKFRDSVKQKKKHR